LSAVAVIPARYASTRFPGKPLADRTGKYLVQHVYEQVLRASCVDRVIIATDDARISEAARSFGADVVTTRCDHPSGTDRVAEVAMGLDCEVVVNVQGDEPEIDPSAIETLVGVLTGDCHPMATLMCSFENVRRRGREADPSDPGCVKVASSGGRALYFSRSVIPFCVDNEPEYAGPYLHIGVYAYRREFLMKLSSLEPTPLERLERLEQLRPLEHGYTIAVGEVQDAFVGIDTPADYEAFVKRSAGASAGSTT